MLQKKVLKYLKGSTDYKIKYGPPFMDIVGYSDARFPKATIDDLKSVSRNIYMFCGGPISWTTHRPSKYGSRVYSPTSNYNSATVAMDPFPNKILDYLDELDPLTDNNLY